VEADKEFFDGCALGKEHRQSFGTRTGRKGVVGEQINADVCGPLTEHQWAVPGISSASKMITRNIIVCSSSPQKLRWWIAYTSF